MHTIESACVPRPLASTLQLEFAHAGGTGLAESQQKRRMSLLAMTHALMGVHASPLTQPSRTPQPALMRLHPKVSEPWCSGRMALWMKRMLRFTNPAGTCTKRVGEVTWEHKILPDLDAPNVYTTGVHLCEPLKPPCPCHKCVSAAAASAP